VIFVDGRNFLLSKKEKASPLILLLLAYIGPVAGWKIPSALSS